MMTGSAKKSKEKIAFLINPGSGTRKASAKQKLMQYVKKFEGVEVITPKSAKDTFETTEELAKKHFQAVFACGGDGTLNLVSSALVGTDTAMAMIPFGSGNGYARHHKIPMQWQKAVEVINRREETVRDTGLINGLHFLNIAGVGYAAKISNAFDKINQRGLSGYLKTIAKNLKRDAFAARVTDNTGAWEGKTWMVEFCNGSQWGNNISIAPGASDDDGTLTAMVFEPFPAIKTPVIGFQIARNKANKLPEVFQLHGDHFVMEFKGTQFLHIDGEAVGTVENGVQVQVVPKSLKIWRFPS